MKYTLELPFLLGWGELRSGTVHLYEDIDLERILSSLDDPINCITSSRGTTAAEAANTNVVCLLNVPAFLIPGDILKFFGAYVGSMRSFKVLRHYSNPEIYMAVLEMESDEAALCIIRDFHGQLLTSLEPAMCILYPVRSVTYDAFKCDDESAARGGSAAWAFESLSDTNQHSVAVSDDADISKISAAEFTLMSLARDAGAGAGVGVGERSGVSASMDNCPLCLDRLCESSSFTTCCNHSFHIQCISRLEGPQCPVCRFQHDSTSEELSSCGICGCQGDDLWVCLVCGFVGCGRSHGFHIKDHYLDYLHTYAMNVSNRCVWDFAGNGYVHRLILQRPDEDVEADNVSNNAYHSSLTGSPGRGRSSTISSSSSLSSLSGNCMGSRSACDANRTGRSNSFDAITSIADEGSSDVDKLQSPPVLGSNRAGEGAGGRARVLLGGERRLSGMKLVEIPDPLHTSSTRQQGAVLSSQQEELLINSKLEIAANHYNQLVTWQLQQHRERYEARLSRVQEHAYQEAAAVAMMVHSQSRDQKASEETWAQKVLQSLVVEKAKVIKQCDAGKERLRLAREELDVLSKLNNSLATNLQEWQQRVDAALQTLTTAEQAYRQGVPKLEKKVRDLMKKLEFESDSSSSSSSSSCVSKMSEESAGGED